MKKLLISLIFFIGLLNTNAQQCSLLDAGPDVTVNCLDNTTTLTATYMDGFVAPTSSYIVQNSSPCPLPPVTSGTPTSISTDDEWSDLINIPFDFVYFGNSFNRLLIGDNGVVSFDTNRTSPQVQQANGYCRYTISASETLPNANFFRNTIYGAFHDLLISSGGTIQYYVSGTAPTRIFVVVFNNVAQFSCTSLHTTQRILLYETLNVIDVQITQKDICRSWNSGLAVIGIQDETGTIAYTPPGRNTSVWGVSTEELWRFAPNSSTVYPHTTTWYDNATGAVVGTGDSINVSVLADTTYRCVLEFDSAHGTHYSVEDYVTVFFDGSHDDVDLGPDLNVCDNSTTTLDGTVTNATGYQWQLNGVDIPGATNATYDATVAGTYTVNVEIGVCSSTDDIILAYEPTPIVDLGQDIVECEGNTVTLTGTITNPAGGETFQWFKDGTTITGATLQTLDVTTSGTYRCEVTNSIGCMGFDEILVTFDPYPNLELGPDQIICPYDTATVTSNIIDADTYTWEINGTPDPTTTGTLTLNGTGSYAVTLTIVRGTCEVTDTVNIEILSEVTITSNPIFYGELEIIASGGLPPYQYSLNGTDYQSSNYFTDLPDDDYPIWVKDSNGCIYEFAPVHVYNLIYPHFFTPNGDGYNDTWRIINAENTPDAKISIYNRYGKLLHIMNTKLSETWNGRFNGNPVPSSDYWFSLILENGNVYKGHFSLKR